MKKTILALLAVLSISAVALCARQFIEGTDYQADFKENTGDMPAVLHINFTNITPTPDEAEKLIKDQLKIYAKIIENEADAKKKIEAQNAPVSKSKTAAPAKKNPPQDKTKDESDDNQTYKNIIGSVWYNVAPQQTQTEEETPAAQAETPVAAIQPSVPVVSLSSGVAVSTGTDSAVKVKFKDDLSAYVYLGKTKRIVPFPEYVNFLKKERDAKKAKDKADAAAAAQTAQQDASQPGQTADQPTADTETKN